MLWNEWGGSLYKNNAWNIKGRYGVAIAGLFHTPRHATTLSVKECETIWSRTGSYEDTGIKQKFYTPD